ncbi:MAG: PAS domain-containing protein [Rhodospirillales bacterium]
MIKPSGRSLVYEAQTQILDKPDQALLSSHGLTDAVEIWRMWAGAHAVPIWKDVDLMDLPNALRGGTMVADYLADEDDFRVRFWGVKLVDAFQIELTGKRLSDVFDRGVMTSFRETARSVLSDGKPQFLLHAITSAEGVRRQFPVVRLPISDDGQTVSKIMTIENVDACLRSFANAV